MKVYDQSLTGAASAGSNRAQEAQRVDRGDSSRNAGAASASGDRVELSGVLGSIARAMSSAGASRSSRVQSLAAQYSSGSYHADSSATSRGMIAEALAGGTR